MHTNSEPSSETLQRKPTRKNSIILFAFIASVLCGLGLWAIEQPSEIIFTAAITLFVAVLWVTEALPIPATSLLPFALFPLFGVLSHSKARSSASSRLASSPQLFSSFSIVIVFLASGERRLSVSLIPAGPLRPLMWTLHLKSWKRCP